MTFHFCFLRKIRDLAITPSGKAAIRRSQVITLVVVYFVEEIATGHGNIIHFLTLIGILGHFLRLLMFFLEFERIDLHPHTGRNGILSGHSGFPSCKGDRALRWIDSLDDPQLRITTRGIKEV